MDGKGVLNGKRVYGFGDSIVYGHAAGISFLDYLKQDYDMSVTKYAVNGASVIGEDNNSIIGQIAGASATVPDFVLFDGLINDAYASVTAKLGQTSRDYTGIYDTTTFCGSFECICNALLTKYPGATILYIAVHKTPARDISIQDRLHALARQICGKWSIPFVDLYNESGLNCFIAAYQSAYSYDHTDANGGNTSTGGSGTHPNDAGYKKFYLPMIASKMIGLS